jgi:hypothetical protein
MDLPAKHPWLFKRGNTYYLRAKVPLALIRVVGRTEIKKSLRTTDRHEACRLIHLEAAEVQALFDRLRSTATSGKPLPSSETLSAREIEDMARTWFSGRLAELEARTAFSMDAAARAEALEQAEMDESDLRSLDGPPLSSWRSREEPGP